MSSPTTYHLVRPHVVTEIPTLDEHQQQVESLRGQRY